MLCRNACDLLRRRAHRQQNRRRIAGQPGQSEHDDRHSQQDHQAMQESAQEIRGGHKFNIRASLDPRTSFLWQSWPACRCPITSFREARIVASAVASGSSVPVGRLRSVCWAARCGVVRDAVGRPAKQGYSPPQSGGMRSRTAGRRLVRLAPWVGPPNRASPMRRGGLRVRAAHVWPRRLRREGCAAPAVRRGPVSQRGARLQPRGSRRRAPRRALAADVRWQPVATARQPDCHGE